MFNEDENVLAILGPQIWKNLHCVRKNAFIFIWCFRLSIKIACKNYDKAVQRIGISKVALITRRENYS